MAVPVSLVITHIMVGMRISSSRLRRIATAVLAGAAVVLVSPLSVTPAAALAATATAITTTEGTQTVAYGGSVAISGTLVRASDKAPLQDGRVYLQQSINGVWTNAGSVVTNGAGGANAYAVGLGASRSWALYWPGNAQFAASRSAAIVVNVGAPPVTASRATQLSIQASAANVAYGGSVAFSGLLTLVANGAPLGGGRVYLQQNVNGVWTNAGSVITNGAGGANAYAVGLGVSRSWSLFWPGNAQFPASRSTAVNVTVAGAPVPVAVPSLRLTFYYPWYPAGWTQPGSNFTPSDGQYDTSNTAEVARQVTEMRYAGLNGAIFSWEGQSDVFSKRLSLDLAAAHGTPFKWSVYYELEGQGNPTVAAIQSDLSYLYNTYANDPNFLHINGKPVIFVWPDANDGCSMLARWAAANANHQWYVVQKEFFVQNYLSCPNQPDAWHEYAPATQTEVTPTSYSVSPGFWHKGDAAQLARSVSAFSSAVQAMKASNKQFELVTTWNEWVDGSNIESATQWASPDGYGQYVDVLHNAFGSQ
jgi:hypothetical protein